MNNASLIGNADRGTRVPLVIAFPARSKQRQSGASGGVCRRQSRVCEWRSKTTALRTKAVAVMAFVLTADNSGEDVEPRRVKEARAPHCIIICAAYAARIFRSCIFRETPAIHMG